MVLNLLYIESPGELCDVYKEPAIGKGANFQINTAKQQWFRRTNIVDELSQSYPYVI